MYSLGENHRVSMKIKITYTYTHTYTYIYKVVRTVLGM